ncbi:MAG TPA: hypothetical protein VGG36_10310 [Rhizomicrobium sp.]|jgi:chromosomal replication initiation ATPase DnaA
MAEQLVLPLGARTSFSRDDFIVTPANGQAVAFIDSWPHWPVNVAALYGPPGSGKSHLASTWKVEPQIVEADALSGSALARLNRGRAIVVEGVGSATTNPARDAAVFSLIESASAAAPVLLTGHDAPGSWPVTLPDLASRYAALLAFALWAPDDAMLAALARKLFADRQLAVPDAVVTRMLNALERSPAAIRDFVAKADALSLAEKRPITTALIQDMLH